MVIHTTITLTTSIIFLLLAGLVWRKRGSKDLGARALSLYAAMLFLWGLVQVSLYGGWFSLVGALTIRNLLIFAVPLIGLFFLDLSRLFLRLDNVNPIWWLGGIALVGSQIILDSLQPDIATPNGISLSTSSVYLSVVIWVVLTSINIQLVIENYRNTHHPLHRNRTSYWAITLILTVSGEAAYYIANPGAGNILLLLAASNATYVILTHRHPDIRLGSLHALSYLITTTLIVVIYTLMYMITQFIFQVQFGSSPLMAGIAMALLLAIFFRPLFTHIQKSINLVLGRVDLDNNQTVREYSLSISNILSLEQLATVSTGLISEALENRRGILFLIDYIETRFGTQYKLIGIPGGMGVISLPKPHVLSHDSPIARYLSQGHRPLIQYDIDFLDEFQFAPPEERIWFSLLRMDVYFPIYSKGTWIGLLAIGPKETGVPYSDADLNLMSTLADQTSVALENARLVEGLYQVNKELEDAYRNLSKTKEELERLDQAKSDFISIASHELRTPLTVIQGYSQMLGGESTVMENPYYTNLVMGIASGSERLHEIIESMLDVAKIDVRELELSPVPFPIQSIIQGVCRNLSKAAQERNLTLEMDNLSSLRPIEADREAIQKVFYHLLINAVKYTPDGGKISIYGKMLPTRNDKLEREAIEVIIQDTGIGIDPKNQSLIFQKFFRIGKLGLHSSGKTKFKGAGPGLGLAIAYGVVNAHGGKIWVESPGYDEEKLPGSEFHIVLPLRQNHK